jgi:hypothetical protein
MKNFKLGKEFVCPTFKNRIDDQSLEGKTVVGISYENGELSFLCSDDTVCVYFHKQDCCESVYLEDITGGLEDLLNTPIVMYKVATNSGEDSVNIYGDDEDEDEDPVYANVCFTYTFYKFATIKGYVDIRWYGSSNGYYSESVDCVWLKYSLDN